MCNAHCVVYVCVVLCSRDIRELIDSLSTNQHVTFFYLMILTFISIFFHQRFNLLNLVYSTKYIMCGIWCCISTTARDDTGNCVKDQQQGTFNSKCPVCSDEQFKQRFIDQNNCILRRGPDVSSSRCFTVSSETIPPTFFHLVSHVLWTQGVKAQAQPYGNLNKFMIFNGDIYSFSGFLQDNNVAEEQPRRGQHVKSKYPQNDGLQLFELLENCKNGKEICSILGNLQGPFAFIFIDTSLGKLWFARDFFGRESLLFSYNKNDNAEVRAWNISSVSVLENVYEIPTLGLYCLEIKTRELKLYPYNHTRESITALQHDFFSALKGSGFVNTTVVCDTKVNLHFSAKLKFPETNVEDSTQDKNTILNCLVNEAESTNSGEKFLKSSINHLTYYIDSLITHLSTSVQRRVYTLPPFCKNCIPSQCLVDSLDNEIKCDHSKVGVLFSGGLDSTVIAYLAADALPKGSSLDLINVAFSKDDDFTNVPDRETAIASYKMLNERFKPQGKIINLVLVNIGKEEVEKHRRERIKYLVSPLKSVLDDSVGVCLWFAARGVGKLHDEGGNNKVTTYYTSPIRVVLLGSGADELLGGYGRHRSAYEKSGWKGLGSEMQLDFDRISIRNMGRDNRIVSDHGICPRIPFLDEHVVDFLTSQCDLWVKCCPLNVGPLGSRGNGEKLLLRAVGAKLFGEDKYLSLALFPKRAMQFGSRIAKLENSKEKGGDSCQRLL